MKYLFCLFSIFYVKISFSQKPIIDSDTFVNWPSISSGNISPDGKYVSYTVYHQFPEPGMLIICNVTTSHKWRFPGCFGAEFTSDSRQVSFKLGRDSLRTLILGTDSVRSVARVIDTSSHAQTSLMVEKKKEPDPDAIQVDVWSYLNPVLLPVSSKNVSPDTVILDLGEGKVLKLENEKERMVARHGDIALIEHQIPFGVYESHWNRAAELSYYLVSLKDGSRKLVKEHMQYNDADLSLSPLGKWIVYYDFKLKNYISYEVATGTIRNITKDIVTKWEIWNNDLPDPYIPLLGKWLADDQALFINDSYDIWQIDPAGIRKPLNLTNGYGHKHLIEFTFLLDDNKPLVSLADGQKTIIVRAINTVTKDMGFYKMAIGKAADPEICSMGAYVYGRWSGHGPSYESPVKAANSDTYLVTRMSATEAPNFFVTTNFQQFTPISDLQPQKAYNWLTAELIHWKTPEGKTSDGILYKPENFDPHKKYPVLFDYYEIRSDELNLYIQPKAAEGRINIPWFVSRGYLVFVPDIHYKIGEPGPSAFNAVVSAARYLSKMPWVDAKHIGVQGHSFGGYETNFIVTHSRLFAAACSAAGPSDLISLYGSASNGGYAQYHYEKQQGRMGATIWQVPGLYIKNSPVFNADKVNTPLLLMNNKKDVSVPFAQGVEFFSALRRLGKKAWMLQYDEGGHGVYGKSAEDYTIRMTQFFDHYLKGAPAPFWMTRATTQLKTNDDGLKLDTEIKTPGPGLNKKQF